MEIEKKPKALFITNYRFISKKTKNGGVKLCTQDFIKVLERKYDLVFLEVDFTKNLLQRLKFWVGVDSYDYYEVSKFKKSLFGQIKENNIRIIFINHTSAMKFAELAKKIDSSLSTVLLSHGNESGDFMHEIVKSEKSRVTSYYKLGKQLVMEAKYRKNYIDQVAVVSQLEENIEYWLHSKRVTYIPRIFEPEFVQWHPVLGKVGFLADFTHLPNLHGIEMLSKELNKRVLPNNFKLVLVGVSDNRLAPIVKGSSFLEHIGYVEEDELKKEVGSWMAYLNIVLYYSKGVSTKLAKGMNMGLPIVTTPQGNRGYSLEGMEGVTAKNLNLFADIVLALSQDKIQASHVREIVMSNVNANKSFDKFSEYF
ncbi:glycosyltransferase [Aegicerativicinus sediminis]|uniref:glycosyltransferase n=1 Tax=Aegicerativicinus sediminis TaxID=2893202 RepID=UPI001E4020B3|nr:glycosyltransferase [Aegicerativicinus sediminis]